MNRRRCKVRAGRRPGRTVARPLRPESPERDAERKESTMANEKLSPGMRAAVSPRQAAGGADRPVEGITEQTGQVNPDSASEHGASAGPVGYFEGEGNEGPLAPLGGEVTKSAEDANTNSQGGVASGAPG